MDGLFDKACHYVEAVHPEIVFGEVILSSADLKVVQLVNLSLCLCRDELFRYKLKQPFPLGRGSESEHIVD